MFGMASRNHLMACSNPECKASFPSSEVLFECPNQRHCKHPMPNQPDWLGDRTIFRPKRFSPRAKCPYAPCLEHAYVMRCPRCWEILPVAMGSTSTIAVVGARTSGKTCYITSLIHQIRDVLAAEELFEMGLEWDDDQGRKYFRKKETDIFRKGRLPEFTQEGDPVSMQITVRFPVRGWRRMTRGSQAHIALVFPDPAGDHFHEMQDIYFLTYLGNASAIILMVDPLAEDAYRDLLLEEGKPLPPYDTESANTAITTLVWAMRGHLNKHAGRMNKSLAVVVAKCDEYAVFDPDDQGTSLPNQGRRYDPRLARKMSRRVESYLRKDLKLNSVAAVARQGFKRVSFFAASALGSTPVDGQVINARPRRVEEPLLWILHQWGYI